MTPVIFMLALVTFMIGILTGATFLITDMTGLQMPELVLLRHFLVNVDWFLIPILLVCLAAFWRKS